MKPWQRGSLEERLFGRSIPEPNSGCIFWLGAVQSKGYGNIFHDGKVKYTHRVSYELAHGPIPDGMEIDHKCRVRCCINPDHLHVVTHNENIRLSVERKGQAAERTVCPSGHSLTGDNRKVYAGVVVCRTCRIEWKRRWRIKKRSAA
jgi:hypothetical protein